MEVTGDEIRNFLSGAAVAVSVISVYFARLTSRQSNRPIVTAHVTEDSSGLGVATFNLVVANTGNRPATHVRLHAKRDALLRLIHGEAAADRKKAIENCFHESSEIPVLRNGEELATAFGASSEEGAVSPKWLEYGAQAEIEITYRDLEGRQYRSRLPLKIYARQGFAGSIWK